MKSLQIINCYLGESKKYVFDIENITFSELNIINIRLGKIYTLKYNKENF